MIEQLNSQEQAWFDDLKADREESAKVFAKESNKGLWRTIEGMYSEEAHFILELLQNANDTQASRVRFFLKPDGLIYAHNGKVHFSVSDFTRAKEDRETGKLGHINSITSIGQSNKNEAQIGKFGIGFKSVFQYTQNPEIYDPPYCFVLKKYIIPHQLHEDHPRRRDGETFFYFPFNHPDKSQEDSYEEILEKLADLGFPNLFLSNLEEIDWETSTGLSGNYRKKQLEKVKEGNVRFEKLIYTTYAQGHKHREHIMLFSSRLKDEKGHKHRYSLGLFTDEYWKPLPQSNLPVYCFFPTRVKPNLPFVLHAPFLLTDNREGIKEGEEWNQTLIEKLAQLMCDSLVLLRQKGLLDKATFLAMPFDKLKISEKRFKGFYDAFAKLLRSGKPLLPAFQAGYVPFSEAMMGESKTLMELLDDRQLTQLSKRRSAKWVLQGVNRLAKNQERSLFDFLQGIIGIKEFTSEQFFKCIHPDFLLQASEDWLVRFYQYLFDHKNLWPKARKKAIILREDGKITAAEDKNGNPKVYLPKSTSQSSSYPTVKQSLLGDEKIVSFFKEIGIREPDSQAEIFHFILPKYTESWVQVSIEDFQHDWEVITNYFGTLRDKYEQENFAQQLKSFYLIPVQKANNKKRLRQKGETGIFYKQNALNKRFFAPYLQNGGNKLLWLDETCFPDIETNSKTLALLQKMGLAEAPMFQEVVLIDNPKDRNWDDFLFKKGLHEVNATIRYQAFDFILHGLEDFIATIKDYEQSRFLLELMANLYKATEENFLEGVFRFRFRGKSNTRSFYSEIKELLSNRSWLYDENGYSRKPRELTLDQLEHYQINEQKEDFLDALGLRAYDDEATQALNQLPESLRESVELARRLAEAGIDAADIDAFIAERKRKERLREEIIDKEKTPQAAFTSTPKQVEEDEESDARLDREELQPLPERGERFRKKLEEKKKELEKEFEEEKIKLERTLEFEEIAKSNEVYSFAWFKAMLNLELLLSRENSRDSKTLQIRFNEVDLGKDGKRTLMLGKPSRYIPASIEDLDNIPLKIALKNEEKIVKIEVVNVRENKLAARLANVADLEDIDIKAVEHASIEIQNPVFVLQKLMEEFECLNLDDYDCLKEELPEDIEFIFGPPGTGKTTHLAREILSIGKSSQSRTLVLAPTNKAADVLVRKIMSEAKDESYKNWLFRFGTTNDEYIDEEGLLIDRTANILHKKNIVLVTTIARFPYDGFQLGYEEEGDLRELAWNNIIFDEASMITLPAILYTIYKSQEKIEAGNDIRFCEYMIAGDPFQIQPVVHLDEWKSENIYKMVELKDFKNTKTEPHAFEVTRLETQYRSIPTIGEIFSRFTYGGILQHHRSIESQRKLPPHKLDLAPITILDFPVNRYKGVYKSNRLKGASSYHVYSAILAVEMATHLSDLLTSSEEHWRLGVICPYRAQADLVEKLAERKRIKKKNFDFQSGTVHGFQGDECEIVIALFNPPPGMSKNPNSFLNKQNILNVAISRPRDYLIIMCPDEYTKDIENLYLINRLKKIAIDQGNPNVKQMAAKRVEDVLFNKADFIFENTFATSHQQVNIYSQPDYLYEIRQGEEAIDIQLKQS